MRLVLSSSEPDELISSVGHFLVVQLGSQTLEDSSHRLGHTSLSKASAFFDNKYDISSGQGSFFGLSAVEGRAVDTRANNAAWLSLQDSSD